MEKRGKLKKSAQAEEYKRLPKEPKTKEQIYEEFKAKQRAQSKIQLEIDRKRAAKKEKQKKYEAQRLATAKEARLETIITIDNEHPAFPLNQQTINQDIQDVSATETKEETSEAVNTDDNDASAIVSNNSPTHEEVTINDPCEDKPNSIETV